MFSCVTVSHCVFMSVEANVCDTIIELQTKFMWSCVPADEQAESIQGGRKSNMVNLLLLVITTVAAPP